MLLHAKLNFNLWGEALLIVCYILNRIPMKKNEISPYELLITTKKKVLFYTLINAGFEHFLCTNQPN